MSKSTPVTQALRRNFFLVGPMGAGKTTIGKQLAHALDVEFVDSDQEIENHTGVNIPWIFDLEGESGFRRYETQVIDDLTQRSGIVLATGGGAVLMQQNRMFLKDRGTVIYFYADLEILYKRTAKDHHRRPLRGQLEKLIQEREPLYREVADLVINTGERNLRNTVQLILDSLNIKL
ncbi:MAG: shikimate kinase AroK [Gammaproteobacteria bacterium]|nr:shikimate kinase AroK [Gammaproteobacteria bacterium]